MGGGYSHSEVPCDSRELANFSNLLVGFLSDIQIRPAPRPFSYQFWGRV